jgi:gliding motility-associated-like protein
VVDLVPNELKIPNVFTPNGDGQNDVFEIVGIEGFDRVEIIIFNRWGNEVYRNNNYRNNWSGQNLNEGTYYYLIYAHKGVEKASYSGWVVLKRN